MPEALGLLRNGRLPEAQAAYAHILEHDPNNSDALHLAGIVAFQSGDLPKAAELMRASVGQEPKNAMVRYNLGRVFSGMEEWRAAAEQYLAAVEINPDYGSAWYNLGNALVRTGKLEDSTRAFAQAARALPKDPWVLTNWGNVLIELNRNHEAMNRYEHALRLDPEHAEALGALGEAQLNAGRFEQAVRRLRAAVKNRPENTPWLLALADALEKNGELDEAEDVARQALKQSRSSSAWFRLGVILQGKNDPKQAQQCYENALELKPECSVTLNNLGLTAKDQESWEQALECFDKALKQDEKYASALVNKAAVLEELGRLEDAEHTVRAAVEIDPSPAAHHTWASILQKMGRSKEAAQMLQRCLELDPEDKLGARLALAAMGDDAPSRASDAFVRNLFDLYAGYFDMHLVKNLEYTGPAVLMGALGTWLKAKGERPQLDILDLGCGTGLCGAAFRPFARRLHGVDLSPKMIAQAKKRAEYDLLKDGELVDFMHGAPLAYDVVLAGDVFVYIGDLEDVFEAAATVLKPEGVFAFTVEKGREDYTLNDTNRYTHSQAYVERLAREQGFNVLKLEETSTRKEQGEPVSNLVVVLELCVA